ncbi:hypothetical protein B0H11DRAFT_1695599, partial [Mycena galericulata]
DDRARGIIHKFISDSILISVGHLKGAKETWDFIVAAHEKVNVAATVFFTLVSMLDTKWDGTSDFDAHVAKIRTGNLRLTGMSRGVDDEFQAWILLKSLPETAGWRAFVSQTVNLV